MISISMIDTPECSGSLTSPSCNSPSPPSYPTHLTTLQDPGQPGGSQQVPRTAQEAILTQLPAAQPELRQGGEEGPAAEAAGGVRGQLRADDQCQDSTHRG